METIHTYIYICISPTISIIHWSLARMITRSSRVGLSGAWAKGSGCLSQGIAGPCDSVEKCGFIIYLIVYIYMCIYIYIYMYMYMYIYMYMYMYMYMYIHVYVYVYVYIYIYVYVYVSVYVWYVGVCVCVCVCVCVYIYTYMSIKRIRPSGCKGMMHLWWFSVHAGQVGSTNWRCSPLFSWLDSITVHAYHGLIMDWSWLKLNG